MKKVVLNSNTIWSISNFRLDLIKHFVASGYEVVCIANENHFNDNSINEIKTVGARFINIDLSRKGLNPFKDIFYIITLLKLLKKEKADLLINYTIKPIIYGSFISKFLKIKSIAVITGLGYVFIKKGVLYRFVKFLYRQSLKSSKKAIFLNQEDQTEFINEGIIPLNKSIVIPGEGINTDYFSPKEKTNQSGKIVFIMICRLLWDKGLKEYFIASENIRKEHDNVEFNLLGFFDENNPSSVSRKEISELDKTGIIKYLGSTNEVRDFIADADCIVLPSYREGLPRTLLEAGSMARPIITTNSVGCKETVEDGKTGFLCNPKDATDLTLKIEQFIMLPPQDRYEMGLKAREKVINQFDQRIINETYDHIIIEIN